MEFSQLIKERRSIRKWKEEAVDQKTIREIVAEAQMAPSWTNSQPARYYVVNTPKEIRDVTEFGLVEFNKKNVENCSALIVTTYVRGQSGFMRGDTKPANELGDYWGAYDLGLSNAYFCLAAKNRGFDTLIMGVRKEPELREMFGIPEDETIMAVLAFGKRDQEPKIPLHKDIAEILKFF